MLYLFEHILNPLLGMSLTAAFVAVVVILLRLVLKKRAPKQVVCLLWLLVFARLLVPVMVESPISLVPPALNEVVSEQMEQAEDPAVPDIDPGDTGDTPVSTPVVPETPAPTPGNVITRPADPVVSQPGAVVPQSPVVSAPAVEDPPVLEAPAEPDVPVEPPVIEDPAAAPVWMYIVPAVWLAGVAAMLVMGVGSYIKLRRRVYDAIRTEDGVWEHPSLASPFILGLIRPKIYLPMGIGGQPRQFILHHERAHLQRLDHVVKPICWLALAIHWFNPLAWAAFLLMSRDIESACDESVIRKLGSEVKADYSATLLALATDKRFPAPSPLSFGEGDAKARIKNVLNFKKPALWVTIAAVVVVVVAAVCLLTDPVGKFNPDDYATLDCYPGLYFEEVTDEKTGITTTKAYKIVEDEPVLVAGWVDHLASNVNTLIHPDGDEEILLAATWEVTARYEQYLVDEMMAQDERWAADYFAGTDRIFQFFDSEGSGLTTIHVGAALTPEGNLLLQYRNDSPQVLSLQTSVPQNADSVKVYVYDRAADGTDRLDILWTGGRKVYSAEPSGSLIFEGDALIAYIWDGETWTVHDSVFEITTADMPVSFDAETQLITVEYDPNAYTNGDPNIAHIDPGIIHRQFPIPEELGHVDTLALSGEAKIVHRTDGDYDLTYGVLAMPEDGTSDADLVHILDVSAIMKWDSLTEEFDIVFTGAEEAGLESADPPVDDPIDTPDVTEPELYFSVTPVEESAANGLFTQFQLTYEGNSVVFDGRAVENEMRAVDDCSSADLNGDGVQELIVSLVTAYGTGVLEQELHVFDSRTLEEYPADGLAEQLAALFTFTANDSAFFITADQFSAAIPKDQLDFGFSVVLLDRISIGENFRYTVEDGKLYCVFSCCVAEGWNYYGELWVELEIDLSGSVVPRGYQLRVDGEVREDSDYPPSDLGELFLSALNDKVEIVDPGLGMTDTLSELVKATAPTVEIHITEMAAVDLDGNGSKELLLKLETPSIGYGTMILHYNSMDGRIYSYVLWFRAFNDVKTDGTFSYSGGASVNGIARISFTPGGYEQEKITYSEWTHPDQTVYFYVNKQPATEKAFLDAFAAQQEKPDLTWTEFTPENAEALIREHFDVTDQAPPSSLGFLGSLPSEIVTSDTLPSDPEEYYLVAQLPESYVWLYARNYGQDSMLLWNGNFWWPLEGRVAHTGHMNLPKMYLLQENASTTTVAVVSEVDTGTGVGVDELVVYAMGENVVSSSHYIGMEDYVYDWRPIAKEFSENNTLVYDKETNSLTLFWNGTAYCTGTLFNELALGYDLEDGFTGKLLAGGDIIRFTPNGDGTFTATMQTAIAGRPMSIGVTGFTLTWNLTFTGSGFEASDLTITVTNKEQTFLEAAFPEEGIYLFALGNGGAYYYLFEGGQLHKVPGAGIMTDLDVNCRLVDLDGDGRMELAIVGNHYAGSSSFGLLNVFDKGTGGWKHYRLPSYAASDTPDYVSPFGEHDLMDDAAAFTIGSDPTQVTMHLSGFDFLFTVSDEAAFRSGDYYVWDGGSSIAWEGDGYYLRLNGSIHRRGGQYGWPSDDCGVTFQFVCRLEYNANGTFEQIPVGILGGTASTLRAAIPEENIYLFRGEGAFGKNYLVTGTRTQELNDSENLGDALIEFDSFDLDCDGEKEIILLTDYYAGSAAFGSLAVLEQENGLWTMNRLQTHLTGYELPVKFGDAVFTVGNDPTRVTMHLSGFDFPFTVSDEAASRNGDYYVWENDRSIAWEGDGYYLRLNGSIHRHGGQYGWPSDDCGVMFQFVCRLEYNADGTFKQIPTGIVRSVSAPQKKLAAATRDFYIADSLYSRLIMFGSPEGTWSGSGLSNVPAESPVELIGLTDTAGVLTYVDAGIYGGVMAVDAYGVLWGHGTYADPDRPTEPVRLLDNVAMVSCGQFDTYILRRDGSLWSYDHNNTGLPTMKTMGVNGVTYHKIMDNVISVEAGGFGSGHAILVDHTLWAWDGTRNQFQEVADNVAGYSDGRIIDLDRNLLADDGSVMLTDVTYANYHYAIKTDGTLWALTMPDPGTLWGRGAPLQTPRLITDEVSYIASGEFESILMKWDGSLWQLAIDGTLSGISFTT